MREAAPRAHFPARRPNIYFYLRFTIGRGTDDISPATPLPCAYCSLRAIHFIEIEVITANIYLPRYYSSEADKEKSQMILAMILIWFPLRVTISSLRFHFDLMRLSPLPPPHAVQAFSFIL